MKKQPNRNIITILDLIDATGDEVIMELSHKEYAAALTAANAQRRSVKSFALNAANDASVERWRAANIIQFPHRIAAV